MVILVNNKVAALKEGTSFDYISENRLFSGSDGYSLSITFPLKGCRQNLEIFGNINRKDVLAENVELDCEIHSVGFNKKGAVTILEISESEVKVQFLEGKSRQNFNESLDDVYINELDLGRPQYVTSEMVNTKSAWYPYAFDRKYVALPWVNNSTGNIQNCPATKNDGAAIDLDKWHPDTAGLSWQPYLLFLIKQICRAIGYECDMSKWEEHRFLPWLIVCNSLPYSWGIHEFSKALPHWSVKEFFDRIEYFVAGEFDFDHNRKRVTFSFTDEELESVKPVCLNNVVQEYSSSINADGDDCDFLGANNLSYAESDHEMFKFYSCDWFIKEYKDKAFVYNTLDELMASNFNLRVWDGMGSRQPDNVPYVGSLFYAKDVDMHFVVRPIEKVLVEEYKDRPNLYRYRCMLQPVNSFGKYIRNDNKDADCPEIKFVPACIDYTDSTFGNCLFLSPASSAIDEESQTGLSHNHEDYKEQKDAAFNKPQSVAKLEAGGKDDSAEFYSNIFVAFWNGDLAGVSETQLPHPFVENVSIRRDWSGYVTHDFSLRLNDKVNRYSKLKHLDRKHKYTFKFIADKLPDVRAVFYIHGKRYICKKLTATFSLNGMSQLIKGEFYPILED